MKKMLIIFAFISVYETTAQEVFVIDSILKNPIENVTFKSDKNGATSDNEGRVNISKFNNNDLIHISHVSYKHKQIIKDSIKNTILLSPKIRYLPTVNLQSYTKLFNIRDNFIYKNISQQESIQKSIGSVLQNTSSVNIQKSQAGGGSPNFRGLEASRLLLVIDGVSLNNTIYRSGHVQSSSSINPFFIESISVTTGPSSISFGDGALGSALVFNTPKPVFRKKSSNYFHQRFESSSNGVFLNFKRFYSKKNTAFLTGFSVKSTGNLKMGRARWHGYSGWGNEKLVSLKNEQLYTSYSQIDFIHKTLIKTKTGAEILTNTQYSRSSDINRFDKLNDIVNEEQKYLCWYYGPQKRFMQTIEFNSGQNTFFYDEYNVLLSFQNINESRHNQKKTQDLLSNRFENVKVYDLSFNANKSFDLFKTKYGLGTRSQKVSSRAHKTAESGEFFYNTTRYPDGGTSVSDIFLYYKIQLNLSKKMKISSGARFNYNNLFASYVDTQTYNFPFSTIQNKTHSLVNSVLINYHFADFIDFKTSFYTGFRNPNVDDLGKVFSKNDDYVVVPNPSLTPEKSNNIEIGIDVSSNSKNTFSIEYFNTVINNAISRENGSLNGQDSMIYDGEMMRIQMNKNIEKAYIYGFNISCKYNACSNLSLASSLTYLKGSTINGAPLSHINPINGHINVKYTYSEQNISFETKFAGQKRKEEYDLAGVDNLEEATDEGTPSWVIFNFSYNYKVDETISVGLGIENIFDIHYKTFGSGISSSGRNFTLSLYTNF